MQVVVVGAGYAGTIAANRLAKKVPDAHITVINPRPEFVERVRLHEELAGSGSAATPLAGMLTAGITTRIGAVEKVGEGEVLLANGDHLPYDYAYLAIGSTVSPMAGTVPVGTWEGALEAGQSLAALRSGSTVTVIGGGLTGIETAAEIAAARPELNVQLVGDNIGASLSEGARRRTGAGLEKLGVTIIEERVNHLQTEPGTTRGTLHLSDGGTVESDLTLWAIIGTVPDLAARSGLEVDAYGRAVVDQYLRSVSNERIFVVGDCAAVPGSRAACATASPQGAHAADTLARIIKGRKLKPYSMGYTGQALSLGRRDGILQMSRRDDTPTRIFIAGRPAAAAKESVNRYAKYGSRTARYGWLRGPKAATR